MSDPVPSLPRIPLDRLVFFHELPDLLGYSFPYVRRLVTPPRTEKSREYAESRFPIPRLRTPAGIRAWDLEKIEVWHWGRASKRPINYDAIYASPFFYSVNRPPRT